MARDGVPMLMLIDEEPAQRRLVSALAARAGWRTIFANDGDMAVAMLGTQDGMRLDAVLLDQWIPGPEATGLVRELRTRRPALPILILTAHNSVAVAVDAMRAGATDYLAKPVAPERLLSALNATLSQEHGSVLPVKSARARSMARASSARLRKKSPPPCPSKMSSAQRRNSALPSRSRQRRPAPACPSSSKAKAVSARM